jgi:sugar phosphate isomerase/epimerase
MKPIAIQLYSLRERAQHDFAGVLKSVADMGYKGVEPAGFHGMKPAEARKIIEDLGMVVCSNHQPWPTLENLNEVVDVAGELGTDTVVCGWGPDYYADKPTIRKTAETANMIVDKLGARGLKVTVHNHYWEFQRVDGALAYDLFMEQCPGLLCELDTYWAANFGANDPAAIVAKYRAKTPLLHMKDGPLVKDGGFLPVGAGKMDIPAVVSAADESVLKWLIVEIDRCDTDMTQAVHDSYTYLVENELASGNK